jgi:phosphoserine phosphatase
MQAPEINVIAFDVDNTLLIEHVVNEDVRDLMVAVHKLGLARIVVWSGGGEDYARMATRDCGIHHMVWKYAAKNTFFAGCRLITVDDQAVKLGEINLKIAGEEGANEREHEGDTRA